MRKSLTKLHYLLFVLLMVAMTGCGANNAGTVAGTTGASTAGAITAKLQWQQSGSAAKALAAIPAGIANIQFTVTGSGANGAIPVVKSTVAANSTQGQIGGIYPGTVAVAVKAVDASGASLYEGFATNVNVAAGATTDVGIITMAQPVVKAEEKTCLGCHETALDKTGQNIVANYKQSGHYTNTSFVDANGQGAGCVGCHGPSHNNPDPSANGTAARCFECHNLNNTNTALVANHGTYYLANATECSACHQMHNTKAGNMERKTWAQSGHGATDFANINMGGSNGCALRCHNAKTFISVVGNPTALTRGTTPPTPQMITCDACHTNAALGKLRNLPGAKATAFATYTTSTPGYGFAPNNVLNPNKKQYYPDVAGSNLCIVCHSGTTEGVSTALGMSDPYFAGSSQALTYTNNGTLSPKATITQHNMPAAAVMYVKFGFTNLSTGTAGTPSASYVASLTSDLDGGTISSTHRKFGTSAIAADSHFSASKPAPANLLTNGPCAVCHVSGSHSYRIDQAAFNAVCVNCHTSENGRDLTTGIDAFRSYFIEPNKEVYNNAILLAATVVNQKVAAYNATPAGIATPLNFTIGINQATSGQPYKVVVYTTVKTGGLYTTDGSLNVNSATLADFQKAAKLLGYSTNGATDATDLGFGKFLGAISNVALFAKDQGGFAHARTYSRRLIYDSIDFLDDGTLNRSVSASAINLSKTTGTAVAGLYGKGTTAYTDGTLKIVASGTTESMLYLVGWNRSTGAWSSPERP
ncbi:hypothetical protein [Geomonas sp.]|uniref:hypothetical protein n=1 Tax=Geomonas sp. TaxID=2651584 RepID=UPI002B470202|nr:hypothetical protein [Geomonas sp.]HJV35705.1 hypothetical protein [Geomonas sp.]